MPKSAEFILQPHLSSVVVVEPYGSSYAAILDKLTQDPMMQTVECISAMDTLSVVRQMGSCVILAFAATAQDVNQHLTILKTLATQVQQKKNVRMIVTAAPSLSAELVEKLTIYGCTEILPDSTPAKAVLFKIEKHLKALPRSIEGRSGELELSRIPGLGGRPDGDSDEAAAPEPSAGVRLAPALELPQDLWCLSGGGARRSDGRWKIRLKGPAPDLGRWAQITGRTQWRWTATDEPPGASVRSGWFFSGEERPEYHRGFWSFTGSSLELGYFESANPVGYKFRLTDKGTLQVAADSEAALSWLAIARGTNSRKIARHEMQVAVGPTATPQALEGAAEVVWVDPLVLESDFWLLEMGAPRRVAERWLVPAIGPGPAVGRWVAQEGVGAGSAAGAARAPDSAASAVSKEAHWSGTLEKWWRWTPDAGELDPFLKEQGAWLFFGLQPNFSAGQWAFASSAPELGFYYDGRCYGSRFRLLDASRLEAARDSAAAAAVLPLIRQSFERPVALRPHAVVLPLPPGAVPAPTADPAVAAPAPGEVRGVDVGFAPSLNEGGTGKDVAFAHEEPGGSVPEGLIASELQAGNLKKIFAAEVPGPTLSPLALVFLASELMARREGDIKERCDRFCAYLSASFGGLRAELWVPGADGQWVCAGTPDHDRGRYRECAQSGAGLKALRGVPMRIVEVRPVLQDTIGILVIGGRGAQKVELSYAQAAARAAVGLVFGAREAA